MGWTHLSDAHPRAMKRYRCVGCWEFIEIGEQHLYRTGVLDGEIMGARWHPECEEYAFSDGDEVWEGCPGQFSRAEAVAFMAKPEPQEEKG